MALSDIFQSSFFPWNEVAGYRVIARPWEAAIRGSLVVLANSPIHSLTELQGKEVGFRHRAAFVGYLVTLNALLKARIHVQEVIAVGHEGIMSQLKAGRVPGRYRQQRARSRTGRRADCL